MTRDHTGVIEGCSEFHAVQHRPLDSTDGLVETGPEMYMLYFRPEYASIHMDEGFVEPVPELHVLNLRQHDGGN